MKKHELKKHEEESDDHTSPIKSQHDWLVEEMWIAQEGINRCENRMS